MKKFLIILYFILCNYCNAVIINIGEFSTDNAIYKSSDGVYDLYEITISQSGKEFKFIGYWSNSLNQWVFHNGVTAQFSYYGDNPASWHNLKTINGQTMGSEVYTDQHLEYATWHLTGTIIWNVKDPRQTERTLTVNINYINEFEQTQCELRLTRSGTILISQQITIPMGRSVIPITIQDNQIDVGQGDFDVQIFYNSVQTTSQTVIDTPQNLTPIIFFFLYMDAEEGLQEAQPPDIDTPETPTQDPLEYEPPEPDTEIPEGEAESEFTPDTNEADGTLVASMTQAMINAGRMYGGGNLSTMTKGTYSSSALESYGNESQTDLESLVTTVETLISDSKEIISNLNPFKNVNTTIGSTNSVSFNINFCGETYPISIDLYTIFGQSECASFRLIFLFIETLFFAFFCFEICLWGFSKSSPYRK